MINIEEFTDKALVAACEAARFCKAGQLLEALQRLELGKAYLDEAAIAIEEEQARKEVSR